VGWTGTGGDAVRDPGPRGDAVRDPGPELNPVERITRFLRRKLGRDIQLEITLECSRALREGGRDCSACENLPSPYGRDLPERVVELYLARLLYEPGMKVLDVGHANGMECHRAMLQSLPGPLDLTGIDIAEPAYDTAAYYSKSIRASIDATPFEDQTFDLIWCISSLEHVGMDNSAYVEGDAAGEATPEAALSEMVRVLRPKGTLLITVPYGRYEDHGWFRNFDETRLRRLLDPVRRRVAIRELYFEHTPASGWKSTEPGRLRTVGYGDQDNAGAAALAAVLLTG